jgi:hypothetical protein
MKEPVKQVVIITCSLALLISCSKINLHGGKGGPAPGASGTAASMNPAGGPAGNSILGGQTGPAPQSAAPGGPPPVDGEWEVDYEFNGNQFMGNVLFSQTGAALAGDGTDQDGKPWGVEAGQIQGTQVSFGKKYANSTGPSIKYTGELKFLQTPEYTGWAMEGTYSAISPDGKTVTGKWVANPTGQSAQPAAEATPPPAQSGGPIPVFGGQSAGKSSAPEHIGDARPVDISGHYDGTYNFNFKKIKYKMWIESDCKKIKGHGYDIVERTAAAPKGKEKDKGKGKAKAKQEVAAQTFAIERGWYDYPKVTIVRQYGKERAVTFKGQLSSNGRDIIMKGETQFGGGWDAHRL